MPRVRLQSIRLRLAEAQNWRCCYCASRMTDTRNNQLRATLEHVLPRDWGGTDDEDNFAIACLGCNIRRDNVIYRCHIQALAIVWNWPEAQVIAWFQEKHNARRRCRPAPSA
ncbi:HNH endonuclease [Rhodopila sp.]|uniref:HNH endonuclease n=1 Tax=Rhodopila sp. TaxID=2480087 RepID=UPI003D0CF245